MKFLLTNDDGYDAPGLAALADVLATWGEVIVVAPHVHVSGCSHQATTHRPLRLDEVRAGWHMLDGSPVDCARVGLTQLATDADWVISGINAGGNLGADVYLSGTVAAARESSLLGRSAIAISQYHRGEIDWSVSREEARRVLGPLLECPRPAAGFWNVNLPHVERGAAPAIVECPVDMNPLPVHYEQREGLLHYRGHYHSRSRTAGSDVDICFGGQIALSWISLAAPTAAPLAPARIATSGA